MDTNSDNSSSSVVSPESLAELQMALRQCGSEDEEDISYCANCGRALPSGQHFCRYCENKEAVAEQNANQSQGSLLILIGCGLAVILIALAYVSGWSLTGPNFEKIYKDFNSPNYARVATDGSYLEIDTNRHDFNDYIDSGAMNMIQEVNRILGLPDLVWRRMEHTKALDGTQTFSKNGLTVRWSYHPNKGLEVIYSKE